MNIPLAVCGEPDPPLLRQRRAAGGGGGRLPHLLRVQTRPLRQARAGAQGVLHLWPLSDREVNTTYGHIYWSLTCGV